MRVLLPFMLTSLICAGFGTATAHADASALRPAHTLHVCVVTLGPHDAALTKTVIRGIRYLYGFAVTTKPNRPLPRHTYYPPRKRYRADKLLDYLDKTFVPANPNCQIVLGFTRVDISVTKGKYKDWGIFGLGSVGGTSAVVSTYRLKRSRSWRTIKKRVVKVVNHELGHVLGLPHYTGPRKGCLMESAHGTITTVDNEPGLLCPESIRTVQRLKRIRLPTRTKFDWQKVL